MNRRVIVALLCVGFSIILALGVVGLYKIHTLKLQAQYLLNSELGLFAAKARNKGVKASFQPFECSGLVFVECKSKEIVIPFSLLSQEINLQNITLKVDEFDFKRLAFVLDSEVKMDVGKYFEVLAPNHIKVRMKFTAEDKKDYNVDIRALFDAPNIDYQAEINADILSSETKKSLFSLFSSDFLKQEMEIKNMIFTLTPDNLDEAMYQKFKNTFGNGLGKKETLTLLGVMIGIRMMQFEGNKEIQEMIAGAGALVLGDADRVRIYARAKEGEKIIPQELIDGDSNQVLNTLVEKYDFETRVEKNKND